jgi:hypothetical protein
MNKNIEIMKIYEGEMRIHPFPRSERNIRALATLSGVTAGVETAVGFILLKEVL